MSPIQLWSLCVLRYEMWHLEKALAPYVDLNEDWQEKVRESLTILWPRHKKEDLEFWVMSKRHSQNNRQEALFRSNVIDWMVKHGFVKRFHHDAGTMLRMTTRGIIFYRSVINL